MLGTINIGSWSNYTDHNGRYYAVSTTRGNAGKTWVIWANRFLTNKAKRTSPNYGVIIAHEQRGITELSVNHEIIKPDR